jgi:hypothetical protein
MALGDPEARSHVTGSQELKGEAGCSGSESAGHPFVARWCDQSPATRSGSSQERPGVSTKP